MVRGGPKERMPSSASSQGAKPKTTGKPKQTKHKAAKLKPRTKTKVPEKKELRKVERQVRNLKKKADGPKADDTMRLTVTLGTIQGQTDNGLNRQIRIPLNPLLAKMSEGASTTPLSQRASLYEMWRLMSCEVRAIPLSGTSNVVGSIGFLVLTLNGLEAGAESIDTIKARRHATLTLGRPGRLKLASRQLAGPRRGWWLVDTSQSPADAYGPAIDMMLAYQTTNLLNTTGTQANYQGPLWEIEMRATYQFSTFHPKPGLQSLVSDQYEQPANVAVKAGEDGSLVMVADDPRILRLFGAREGRAAGRTGKGQTVWAVAGAAINAAAPFLGPWGWLLRGGFFLVRKIFGAQGANTQSTFQIYPSITQAMEDQPIFGSSTTGSASVSFPVVHISEVMNPNSENNDYQLPGFSGNPQLQGPYRPTMQPTPVYGTSNDQSVAKSAQGAYLVGNFTWNWYTENSSFRVGVDDSSSTQVKWCAAAQFTEKQVQFLGTDGDQQLGPGGAVGTALTWSKSFAAVWEAQGGINNWKPSDTTWIRGQGNFKLPARIVTFLNLQGDVLIARGEATGAPLGQTVTELKEKLNQVCWVFVSRNGGAGVVCFSQAPLETPVNLAFLHAPILIQLKSLGTFRTSGLNLTYRIGLERDEVDEDDDISIADSFLGPDALEGVELEREQLLTRLRQLDALRFNTG
uniref:Astrovirus capsid protein inner core domain-containing protein n=1 Tax=Fuchs virus TaxID=2707220 RepID=A0A6H0DK61_9VIRU|nr:MAG: hypothetical protein [Fuchs virus]